ncbi:hypothetical protein MBLNU230_g6436t1 [Neophaeotheca triangularis]
MQPLVAATLAAQHRRQTQGVLENPLLSASGALANVVTSRFTTLADGIYVHDVMGRSEKRRVLKVHHDIQLFAQSQLKPTPKLPGNKFRFFYTYW